MKLEGGRGNRLLDGLLALLTLVVPALAGADVYFQWRTPVVDCPIDWPTGAILEVPPDSLANYAGLMAGDVILTINGLPFAERDRLATENYSAEIERAGQIIILEVPLLPLIQVNLLALVSALVVAAIFWGAAILLLLRRLQPAGTRVLFLLTQVLALAGFLLLAHPPPWPRPAWVAPLGGACFHLAAPLLLHHALTFPVPLGTARSRRWGLSLLYGLAWLSLIGGLLFHTLWMPGGVFYTVLVIAGAIGVWGYVYARRASPDHRRRLRLIILGNLTAAGPPTVLYFLPIIAGLPDRTPSWLLGCFMVAAPLSYIYAMARHNLFGIDRLLNRTLVYVILSVGILLLYLGPFLLIARHLAGDWLAQAFVVAGLTLVVGLSFDWTRARVQRWVDRFFYGGWYDYPGVVGTISDALARSIEREQLTDVLTRQVPQLMRLHPGQLWISGPDQTTSPAIPTAPDPHPQLQFPLTFQGHIRGRWTVGPRRDGEDFSAADRRILHTLARQAETALGNVLLVETLRRQLAEIRASREALAQTQRQLLRSREDERARLARDLHDGPIQDLVGLNIQLGLLLADGGDTPLAESHRAMRAEVRNLLAELRQVCADLRPPMLDTLGLGAALRALAAEWSAQTGVAVHLDAPPDAALRPLPEEVAVNLYRVAQEALSNVAHHAVARRVTMQLTGDASHLTLTIQDDGRGFTAPPSRHDLIAQGRFGLAGMQERVDLIGGAWSLESAPGQGTMVRVVWPANAT